MIFSQTNHAFARREIVNFKQRHEIFKQRQEIVPSLKAKLQCGAPDRPCRNAARAAATIDAASMRWSR